MDLDRQLDWLPDRHFRQRDQAVFDAKRAKLSAMATMTSQLSAATLKDRQRALRDGFTEALGLRVHRSISWLGRAEAEADSDVRFILLWIGFNAAYASNIGQAFEQIGSERETFTTFFDVINGFDIDRRIYGTVWDRFSQEIRVLLDNQYIFGPFWKHHNGDPVFADWAARLERANTAVNHALLRRDTTTILSILFDRLYVLRNQLVHGGATFESKVNRAQVRDGCAILGTLLPLFIDLMMNNPYWVWAIPHYPVVD